MKVIFIYLTLLSISNHVRSDEECSSWKTECNYWLTVEEKLTMLWKNIRVYAVNRTLYRYDESPENHKTKIPNNEVITADGFDRTVVAVNNTVPGPPIVVYEGQLLVIHVANHLLSDSITIHWHGLHQEGTPYMDGVAYITQCPISAGQTFTYRFYAKPKGTFWYHSHIGGQRVDGLFGAIIIKERTPSDAKDMIMHVGDWFHALGSQLHTMMTSAYFKSQPKFKQQKTLDGVYYAPAIFKSALIEGRGQYYNPTTEQWNETPFMEYFVKSGEKYRFRVICHGLIYPFRISVDSHTLTIVSSDGYDVKPREFESFIINPGERYDFIITANQTIGNYWIRADTLEVGNPNHFVRAILRYENSTELPTTNRTQCTVEKQCTVLNCPFKYYPKDDYTLCVNVDELENLINESPPKFEEDSIEVFMNFVQDTEQMNINGRHFVHPGVNSFAQSDDIDEALDCNKKNCNGSEICYCYNELDIPFDKTVQMIWSNHPFGSTRHHPIHLHGHSFYVLKMGYGSYNEKNGTKEADNWNIDCGSTKFCIQPTWRINRWKNGNIPGLNLKNPPRKDTLMIPSGAYAVIRIRSDNPGKWFLHCHIEFHAMQGMAMVINEAQNKQKPPPEGFPICQNFRHDKNGKVYLKKVLTTEEKPVGLTNTVVVLGVLSFLFFILLIILTSIIVKMRQHSKQVPSEIYPMKS